MRPPAADPDAALDRAGLPADAQDRAGVRELAAWLHEAVERLRKRRDEPR